MERLPPYTFPTDIAGSPLALTLRLCKWQLGLEENTMKRLTTLLLLGVSIVAGCATRAENIQASYVSPILYQNLTCEQLALEAQNVSSRAAAAAGVQNQRAGNDAALMAVGLVVFWPALLFTGGDGASAAEVSRLKGEMDAIQSASNAKGCGIQFQQAPSPRRSGVTAAS